jgi:hypothetical protein
MDRHAPQRAPWSTAPHSAQNFPTPTVPHEGQATAPLDGGPADAVRGDEGESGEFGALIGLVRRDRTKIVRTAMRGGG